MKWRCLIEVSEWVEAQRVTNTMDLPGNDIRGDRCTIVLITVSTEYEGLKTKGDRQRVQSDRPIGHVLRAFQDFEAQGILGRIEDGC